MELLTSEIEKLGVKGTIAVRIDVQRGDIRQDGMLRARASVGFPGVVVSFESRYGPLSYATDEYDSWQANVRAIALSLQALRAVDRYGVSKWGEQYAGWRAIESGRTAAVFASADEAERWLQQYGAGLPLRSMLRVAAKVCHPDANGGDRTAWNRYEAARQMLGTATRSSADPGDVTGTPGLVWQMKYTARFEWPAVFAANLAETEAQRAAAGADHGLLVQRRSGTADVGKWWVHVTGRTFAVLLTGQEAPEFDCVARVTLAEFALLLRRAGYGTPLENPVVA
jgi:hypothetical protein